MLATSFSPVADGPFTLNTVVEYLLFEMKVRGLRNNPANKITFQPDPLNYRIDIVASVK
jgi:hypothetical protein